MNKYIMKSLFNKTYLKFLFGFMGIILIAVIVILVTGAFTVGSQDLDESDINFANTENLE